MPDGERGQAALDFLMTYGWAILLVVLVAAALFVFGIFDVNKIVGNKASGFSEMGVPAFQLRSNGTFYMKIQNQAGRKVDIYWINASLVGTNANTTIHTPQPNNIGAGATTDTIIISGYGTQTAGDSYTMKVDIGYVDKNTNFSYFTSGTLNGVVTS